MDPSRWRRVQELFHGAVEIDEAARRTWLESRCADDPTLVANVLAMLEEDARGASLLDRSVGDVAQHVVDDAAEDALPRHKFGPYRITRVLGEGGGRRSIEMVPVSGL